MNPKSRVGTVVFRLLFLTAIVGCLAEDQVAPVESPRTDSARERDLRDAPRCEEEDLVVDERLAGRWVIETMRTNPGSGPGCDSTPLAFVDTTDLCIGDTIFVGSDYDECTMVGDASDFVLRLRYSFEIVPGCVFETVVVQKVVFNGDSYYGTSTISQTLDGSTCGPYKEFIECVGWVLTYTGRRIGPAECSGPKRVALHERLIETIRSRAMTTSTAY